MSILRYLWAAPNTLVGLSLLPVVWLTRGHSQIFNGVIELYGGALAWLLKRVLPVRGGVAAMTIGHVVIARDHHALVMTREHERVHVRQYERWGPLFPAAYVFASFWAGAKGQDLYYDNYFEREARRVECQ